MYSDRSIIFDLVEKYPDKQINLTKYFLHNEEIDWKEISTFNTLTNNNFLFGVSFIDDLIECKRRNIACYYLEPVRTYRELNGLKALGVSYAIIDAPLFFQMKKVSEFNIPVRVTANLAVRELLPYDDGVPGPWIRPEDVEMYEDYVDMIEFGRVDLEEERALFRIYAEQHKWAGDLGMIIKDLNHIGTNRMIPPMLAERRLNCGQRCQESGTCRICWRLLDLANPDLLRDYQKYAQ
jgi:hypothetical protein